VNAGATACGSTFAKDTAPEKKVQREGRKSRGKGRFESLKKGRKALTGGSLGEKE